MDNIEFEMVFNGLSEIRDAILQLVEALKQKPAPAVDPSYTLPRTFTVDWNRVWSQITGWPSKRVMALIEKHVNAQIAAHGRKNAK